jgi:hypothetical protein
MAAGSVARGGETACTPPQAGQLCTKVSSTNGFPQLWQVQSKAPLGNVDTATEPPWAFSTNSTNALPDAKGPTPGVRDDPHSHIFPFLLSYCSGFYDRVKSVTENAARQYDLSQVSVVNHPQRKPTAAMNYE